MPDAKLKGMAYALATLTEMANEMRKLWLGAANQDIDLYFVQNMAVNRENQLLLAIDVLKYQPEIIDITLLADGNLLIGNVPECVKIRVTDVKKGKVLNYYGESLAESGL